MSLKTSSPRRAFLSSATSVGFYVSSRILGRILPLNQHGGFSRSRPRRSGMCGCRSRGVSANSLRLLSSVMASWGFMFAAIRLTPPIPAPLWYRVMRYKMRAAVRLVCSQRPRTFLSLLEARLRGSPSTAACLPPRPDCHPLPCPLGQLGVVGQASSAGASPPSRCSGVSAHPGHLALLPCGPRVACLAP